MRRGGGEKGNDYDYNHNNDHESDKEHLIHGKKLENPSLV